MKKSNIFALILIVLILVGGLVGILFIMPQNDVVNNTNETKLEEVENNTLIGKVVSNENETVLLDLDEESTKKIFSNQVLVKYETSKLPQDTGLTVGSTIEVTYNGQVMKSMPPRVNADRIKPIKSAETEIPTNITGEILEVIGNSFKIKLLSKDAIAVYGEELVVNKTTETEVVGELVKGDIITVITVGKASTRSIPAQVNAKSIYKLNKATGIVENKMEKGLLVKLNEESVKDISSETVVVNVMDNTFITDIALGDTVVIYYTGAVALSLPPQISGILINKI